MAGEGEVVDEINVMGVGEEVAMCMGESEVVDKIVAGVGEVVVEERERE